MNSKVHNVVEMHLSCHQFTNEPAALAAGSDYHNHSINQRSKPALASAVGSHLTGDRSRRLVCDHRARILIPMCSFYAKEAVTRYVTGQRVNSALLRQVAGNVVGVLIFIIGIYIALRVSGLTRLAVTLLGGTGLVGLALGFAFRDIAENYLSSILLSLNHRFCVGDLNRRQFNVLGQSGYT